MIELSIIFQALIFLPADLGFLCCFLPRIIFPFSIAMLLSYAALSVNFLNNSFSYAFTLIGDGGIQFSIDQYTFPLVFALSLIHI